MLFVAFNGISLLDCKIDKFSRDESRSYRSDDTRWMGHRLTDKRYLRDNRLITLERPYRRICLAPRCWLITSWSWSRFQGFGCSPIKVVRELSLERRETVWPLSTISVKKLKSVFSCTRGPKRQYLWFSGYFGYK